MTNVTKDFIKQLEDLRKNFIWNRRRPKIKHSTLIGDYVDGGYKDVDIETKLLNHLGKFGSEDFWTIVSCLESNPLFITK